MLSRQATLVAALGLLLGACAPQAPAVSPPTATLPPSTSTAIPPTATPTIVPTATPLACLTQPGRVDSGVLDTTKPPQQFLIYLPPCYDEQAGQRYPVLYLLHGQTYTDDQWVRLGAPQVADRLIHADDSVPFIIVFPDDRYWNLEGGAGFGDRLVEYLIPYIDANYRTLADRPNRALGGLSRGGGWTVRLGLTHPDLFGALGLHSPAVFNGDGSEVYTWLAGIPPEQLPRLWLDVGDRDKELGYARLFEKTLTTYEVPHEFHLYTGDHTETYWGQHVEEYLRWYTAAWTPEPACDVCEAP